MNASAVRVVLARRYGSSFADGVLRATGVIGLVAIPVALVVPDAAELIVFVLVTIWLHGPASPLFPGTYEPVLLLFGGLHSPVIVAVVGALACAWIEFINYHLHRSVLRLDGLARIRQAVAGGRFMRLFERWPFFAVWLCIVSPIPDWIVRILAPAAEYSVRRYLVAGALANLLRFWVVAALGARWQPDARQVGWVLFGSLGTMLGVLAIRRLRRRSRPDIPSSIPLPAPTN